MDLIDDGGRPSNAPEFTVSELSGAVKQMIEGEFAHVRVRGEVSRVSRPASGHLYFDLKDDRSVIAAVSWKGQAARMTQRPEEGMEVIAIGRMTTFPGQSKYQLIVEDLVPAGAGALMAMLEKRKAALQAEGLFDAGRKKPLPWLPGVIGVVTSPSGAVIRDILHRLRDRFPRRVLIWPVAVQGEKSAPEVAAAIRGFNALPEGGPIPRPDLLIVARGGGSIEDLWGFNDERVVRAAAASRIPLISAVGHETDTTLIDYAADRRAPTPTAAAEMAVPVRAELRAGLAEAGARLIRAMAARMEARRQRALDLGRMLGRPERVLAEPRQRLDAQAMRLPAALRAAAGLKRVEFAKVAGRHSLKALQGFVARTRSDLDLKSDRLSRARARAIGDAERVLTERRAKIDDLFARLDRATRRGIVERQTRLADLRAPQRSARAIRATMARLADRLAATDRTRQTLGYRETLARGFAVVWNGAHVATRKPEAEGAGQLEVEFFDGRLAVEPEGPAPRKVKKPEPPKAPGKAPDQGTLF
jgi:exodeoxyribonuclease VII large subunit